MPGGKPDKSVGSVREIGGLRTGKWGFNMGGGAVGFGI